MPGIQIAPVEDDAAFTGCVPLLNQFFDGTGQPPYQTEWMLARFRTARREGYRFYAAYRDGRMVGVGGLRVLTDPMDPAPVGEINNLIVDRPFRKTGVGRQLLAALEDVARAQGACAVRVLVSQESQNLTRYYQALGYQVTGVTMLRSF